MSDLPPIDCSFTGESDDKPLDCGALFFLTQGLICDLKLLIFL